MSTTEKFQLHYRQQLSALMDSQLDADASRFLLRRLEHDADLCGCFERWQLYGDVLRGAVGAPAPLHFSARVRDALAAGTVPAARLDTAAAQPWRRMRWKRTAAIAASLAVVTLFMARQHLPGDERPSGDLPRSVQPLPVVAATGKMQQQAAADDPAAVPPAAFAAASARRHAARVPGQQDMRSRGASQQQESSPMVAALRSGGLNAGHASPVPDPFTYIGAAVQAKSWPRSGLARNADSAINASLVQDGSEATFYPFDPGSPQPQRMQPLQPSQD